MRNKTETGAGMPEPRKIFRIEQTATARLDQTDENAPSGLPYGEIMRELRALRAALAVAAPLRAEANGERADGRVTQLATDLNLIAGAIRGDGVAAAAAEVGKRNGPLAETPHVAHRQRIARCGQWHRAGDAENPRRRRRNRLSLPTTCQPRSTVSLSRSWRRTSKISSSRFLRLAILRSDRPACRQGAYSDEVCLRITSRACWERSRQASVAAAALHGPRLDGDHGHASQDDIDAMFAD